VNNGVYTVSVNAGPTQVSSPGVVEFPIGVPGQKVLVYSGIAIPEMDTNDDDDVGHPRVFVRLGRFVRQLLSSSVIVGLASISNDDSGLVIATDTATAERDAVSGELFLNIGCGLSGDGTWIHRIGYQAVFVVAEDPLKITGEIQWPQTIRDVVGDTVANIAAVVQVHGGQLISLPAPAGSPPNTFGSTMWQPYGDGTITSVLKRGDTWVASYEIVNLPVVTPIQVQVSVDPPFAGGRTYLGVFRVGGPDPVILTGTVPEVDGVNFRIGVVSGLH
jgi:hypothetical protein